jgi:hypothetical protein
MILKEALKTVSKKRFFSKGWFIWKRKATGEITERYGKQNYGRRLPFW